MSHTWINTKLGSSCIQFILYFSMLLSIFWFKYFPFLAYYSYRLHLFAFILSIEFRYITLNSTIGQSFILYFFLVIKVRTKILSFLRPPFPVTLLHLQSETQSTVVKLFLYILIFIMLYIYITVSVMYNGLFNMKNVGYTYSRSRQTLPSLKRD